MKVILYKDQPNLGEEGDIKVVADGYARNYLIPKKIAVAFTKANQNSLEQKKAAIEKRKDEKRKNALSLKERLVEENITIKMPAGEKGRLFGSVTPSMIADEFQKSGISVEKKKIEITQPVKTVGNYTVLVKLYGGETADVKLVVEAAEANE